MGLVGELSGYEADVESEGRDTEGSGDVGVTGGYTDSVYTDEQKTYLNGLSEADRDREILRFRLEEKDPWGDVAKIDHTASADSATQRSEMIGSFEPGVQESAKAYSELITTAAHHSESYTQHTQALDVSYGYAHEEMKAEWNPEWDALYSPEYKQKWIDEYGPQMAAQATEAQQNTTLNEKPNLGIGAERTDAEREYNYGKYLLGGYFATPTQNMLAGPELGNYIHALGVEIDTAQLPPKEEGESEGEGQQSADSQPTGEAGQAEAPEQFGEYDVTHAKNTEAANNIDVKVDALQEAMVGLRDEATRLAQLNAVQDVSVPTHKSDPETLGLAVSHAENTLMLTGIAAGLAKAMAQVAGIMRVQATNYAQNEANIKDSFNPVATA